MQDENVTGWWHTCVKEKTLGSFFDAADALYAIQPWRHQPDHSCLIHMMMPSFGKRTWVVSVLGQEDIDSRGTLSILINWSVLSALWCRGLLPSLRR